MEPPPPQYWMWNGTTNNSKSLQPLAPPPNPLCSSYEEYSSWEEQAFAEDAAGPHGGCVWPPRSYSCTFCRREFRSAQALGGHMNVHRRDRARLKQSPIHPMEIPIQSSLPTSPPPSLSYHFLDNPYKPPPDLPTSNNPNRVSTDNNCSEKSFFPWEEERIKRKRPPDLPRRSNEEDEMTSLNLVLRQSSQSTVSSEEDEVAMGRGKRRRIDDTASLSLPFMLHEIRNDNKNNSNKKNSVGGCAREELDLELRLGSDRPQVKSI